MPITRAQTQALAGDSSPPLARTLAEEFEAVISRAQQLALQTPETTYSHSSTGQQTPASSPVVFHTPYSKGFTPANSNTTADVSLLDTTGAMESLVSALQKVGDNSKGSVDILQGGMSGEEFMAWSKARLKEGIRLELHAKYGNKYSEFHASQLLQHARGSIQSGSEPEGHFDLLIEASEPGQLAAEAGLYLEYRPSPKQLAITLGGDNGRTECVARVHAILKSKFAAMCDAARRKGWLSSHLDPEVAVSTGTASSGAAASASSATTSAGVAPPPASTAAAPPATPAVTPTTGVNKSLLIKGKQVSPHQYVFLYTMELMAIKFGFASLDQENEFKTLEQGPNRTIEAFANELTVLRESLLEHHRYSDIYVAVRFVQGLYDKKCAAVVEQQMVLMKPSEITLQSVLLKAQNHQKLQQELEQVKTETKVASDALARKSGKTPSAAASAAAPGESNQQVLQRLRKQLMDISKEVDKEHAQAPCIMPGHRAHSNAECKHPNHPRNKGLHQPNPAHNSAAAAVYSSGTPGLSHEPSARPYTHEQYQFAAALQGGSGRAAAGAGGRWWQQPGATDKIRQHQSQPPRAAAAAASPNCKVCGLPGGHGPTGSCWYLNPEKARPGWRPSGSAPYTAIKTYQTRCAQLGIPPLQPTDPSGGERQQAPRAAAAALVAQEEEAVAAACWEAEEGWWSGAALVPCSFQPAAVAATRGKQQPHSFVPPDNAQPRAAEDRRSSNSMSAAVVPSFAGAEVNLSFKVAAPRDMRQILRSLGMEDLDQYSVSAAGLPEAKVDDSWVRRIVYDPSKDINNFDRFDSWQEPPNVGSCSSHIPPGRTEPGAATSTTPPAGAAGLQHVINAQIGQKMAAMDKDSMLNAYKQCCESQTLYQFLSLTPEQGVSIELPNGRRVLVPRAVQDGGCIPNLMTQGFADAIGIPYKPLEPEEQLKVRNIEGLNTSCLFAKTCPLTAVLAAGTPQEARLKAARGFLVVRGDGAHEMYDVILGRDLLAAVSGFVLPVAQQFCYMPKLPQGDLTLCTLPVSVGRSRQLPAELRHVADATQATAALIPACMGVVQEELQAAAATSAGSFSAGDCSSGEKPNSRSSSAADNGHNGAGSSIPSNEPARKGQVPSLAAGWYASATTVWDSSISVRRLLLFAVIFPVMLLLGVATDVGWLLYQWHTDTPRWETTEEATRYYRLGKGHRSATGDTIYLKLAGGHSGNKPRCIRVHRRKVTVAHMLTSIPTRVVFILLIILGLFLCGTTAMNLHQGIIQLGVLPHQSHSLTCICLPRALQVSCWHLG